MGQYQIYSSKIERKESYRGILGPFGQQYTDIGISNFGSQIR